MDAQVEGVLPPHRVTGRILELRIAEDAQAGEGCLRTLLLGLAIPIAGTEIEPVVKHLGTYPQLPFVVDGQILVADRVGRLLVAIAIQVEIHITQLPRDQRIARHSLLGDDP